MSPTYTTAMGRFTGFVLLVVVVAIGGYIYTRQAETVTAGLAPATQIDITGVRNDLMAIANAERRYWATNSKYASLDELRTNGDIHIPTRGNYTYSAEGSEMGFKIVAVYTGPDPKAPKHITVDQSMAVIMD